MNWIYIYIYKYIFDIEFDKEILALLRVLVLIACITIFELLFPFILENCVNYQVGCSKPFIIHEKPSCLPTNAVNSHIMCDHILNCLPTN